MIAAIKSHIELIVSMWLFVVSSAAHVSGRGLELIPPSYLIYILNIDLLI